MTVIRCAKPLVWGEIDVPLYGLLKDWFGKDMDPPAAYCIAVDPEKFWFIATHGDVASLHPQSRPAKFTPELWKFDLAEVFIKNKTGDGYLEFNLSPNSAWWSAEFEAPRRRIHEDAFPGVETYSELAPDGGWVAALSIPLKILEDRVGFGEGTCMNVAFILGSPAQRFFSASDLGAGAPDFHRPNRFQQISFKNA